MNNQETSSPGVVPGSMAQVGIVVKYTFLDYFRSRRFAILLAITLAISVLLTAIVGYYRPSSFLDNQVLGFYNSWWGMTASLVVILSGIFFGGDAISGEFQNKTGYFVVANPIRRSSIYVGKWLAAFTAATVILAIFTMITVGNGLYYFGASIPYQFGESLLFSWFYLASVLGFTFFFSSLFKSSSYSILVTAILFLFAFSIIESVVAGLAQVEPWFIITYGAGIIGNVMQSQYPQHQITQTLPGPRHLTFTTYNVTIPEGLAILGVYFVLTSILGLLLFERKEFN